MKEATSEALTGYRRLSQAEMRKRARAFYTQMKRRRTVRVFSDEAVGRSVIEDCLRTASTAPSGANQQPWTFVVVSDPLVKKEIRRASEKVEKEFYSKEATKRWVNNLKHLGTVPSKPFLEKAPCLIVIFSQLFSCSPGGEKQKHYYVLESVGIATGILITALHHAGLASLTYTPANMRFLNKILSRPKSEKAFMILVAGYPVKDALVPVLHKKTIEDIAVFV